MSSDARSGEQVEADLQLARLLAGLHGARARREVSEKASLIQEAALQLILPEDRLYAMMEAAQVIHLHDVFSHVMLSIYRCTSIHKQCACQAICHTLGWRLAV